MLSVFSACLFINTERFLKFNFFKVLKDTCPYFTVLKKETVVTKRVANKKNTEQRLETNSPYASSSGRKPPNLQTASFSFS